ncbi:MAG: phosphate starvation-induced protein, partial [Microbacteriaceae bacterium]|nr:phosphate starvation-induced protein [Microbacteriaceae bacterium]
MSWVPKPGAHSRKAALPSNDNTIPEPVFKRVDLEVDGVAMVRLLGPQDRLLHTIEQQFPLVNVHVRGNHITLTVDPDDEDSSEHLQPALLLVEELIQMVRNGVDLGDT